jgi:hypothetical protein
MPTTPPEQKRVNTLGLVTTAMSDLRRSGCETWLCGGWAEELYGWAAPRPHRDIDLVLPAAGFAALDAYLRRSAEVAEIRAKRFRHPLARVRRRPAAAQRPAADDPPSAAGHARTRRCHDHQARVSLASYRHP